MDKLSVLTDAERWIVKLILSGHYTNKDIAKATRLSIRTIDTHLLHIYRKLNFGNRTELALTAEREGWFKEP